MKKTLFTLFLLGSLIVSAADKFIQVPAADKINDKDISFAVTFDKYTTVADFAKGDPLSPTMKDVSLMLRGIIGFDRRQGFKPEPGEDLKFNVAKNIDPHNGTLTMWLNGQDYVPGVNEKRGNIAYAYLKFQDEKRTVELVLYEFESVVYFDWFSSEPPHGYNDVGRVSVPLQGIRKNEWFQIGATWSDSELAIYLNGKLGIKKRLPAKVSKTADMTAKNNKDSYIGIKNIFYGDYHKYATAVDDFKIYSRPLSPAEMANNYNALLTDKSEAKIVAYELNLNGVDRGGGKDSDKLEAEFDFTALPAAPAEKLKVGKLEISYTLTRPDGKKSNGNWSFSKNNECKFLDDIDIPGKYVLETLLDKEKVTAEIVRPDLSFIGNKIGDEDTVPAIWKDFAIDGRKVTLWNRVYKFGAGPLPESITVKGMELLAKAPAIMIDGKVLTDWEPGKTTSTNRSVTYAGTGKLPGGTIDYATTVEFDGLIKCYYTIKGTPEINSMKLKWQVNKEFCQFLMRPEVYEKKTNPAEFLYFNRMENSVKELWLVSENGGFAYEPEHDANWVYDPAAPVYKVDMNTGECEVAMVTKTVKMPEDTQYHALFIATPTRPLPEKLRVLRHNDMTRTDSFKLDQIGAAGLLTSPSGFEPHPTQFSAGMKNAPPYTVGVYGMANSMTTGSPPAVYFKKYWEIPGGTGYVFIYKRTLEDGSQKNEQQNSITTCNATSFNDLMLYNKNKLLNHEYADRLSMIYYDLCGNDQCKNELHGCAFNDKFGRKIYRFSILDMRKLIERTVRQCHAKGKLVMLHGQRDYHPMIQGLCDYWYPGEQYESLMAQSLYPYTDVLSETLFKSELNKNVIGTGVLLLTCVTSQNRASLPDDEIKKATEAMCAMTLLYDIEISALYVHVSVCAKIWDALEKYDIGSEQTKFHRFDSQHEVKSSNPGVRVSYYECPDNKYVLILSNKDIRSVSTEIDLGRLGKAITEAKEEYIGTDIKVENGKFTIKVPLRSFRIVAFPPKQFYPVKDSCSALWGTWAGNASDAEFRFDAKTGHDKPGSLKLIYNEDTSGCFLKRFPVKHGKTYTASIWVRQENAKSGSISFQGLNGNEFIDGVPTSASSPAADEWRKLEVKFTIPSSGKWEKCDTLLLTLGANGKNSKSWFDDFTMTEE